MAPTIREIRTTEDANSIRAAVESVFDGYYADEPRIDWQDFLDRLEASGELDLGSEMNTPAIRRIKAMVRELRAQQ